MQMAASYRAGAPCADTPSRRLSKRSYVDMDDEDSDTSEYMPVRKGKKRVSAATDVQTEPVNTVARPAVTDLTEGQPSFAYKRRRNVPGSFRDQAGLALHSGSERVLSSDGAAEKHVSPEAASKRPVITTQARLEIALAEVAQLRDQLAVADQTGQQNVMKARQDQVFHVEAVTKRLAHLEEKYRRVGSQLNSAQRRALDLDMALTTKAAQISVLDARINAYDQEVKRLKLERDSCAQDSEHYQNLLTIAEDETQELRRIETEDRAHRARDAEKRTLPPAYGGLPDDNPVASIEEAKDSGGDFEVATFKHTIRSTFMATLARAQSTWEGVNSLPTRTPTQRNRADGELVLALASALAEASRNIDDVLKRAREFRLISVSGDDSKAQRYQVHRKSARQEYVADRFAKLILDLVVRALAALELRPLSASLRPRASTRKGDAGRLFEVQYYVTHVSLLQSRLQMWRAASALGDRTPNGDRREYFQETEDWLQERVESERMHVAGNEDSESLSDADVDSFGADPPAAHPSHSNSPLAGNANVPGTRTPFIIGTVPASPPRVAVDHAAAPPLAAAQTDGTVPDYRAPGLDTDSLESLAYSAARQMIMQNRANATHHRMGMHRRSSLHSSGGRTPNSSQGSATATSREPMVSRGTNPETPPPEPWTARRNTRGRASRSASQVSVSSEATPWPSDAESEGDDQGEADCLRGAASVDREVDEAANEA
ncbi:hypothetical protein B0A55_05846 [Friedmanniomyces simplex]|uniref:Uncharacterized protein n=1 Tax=Friedmanniomyces simplex TaxID=329884 RepID=A0A4U0XI50_9PEZI|nr:hypothetical protein B0A55_05846 [Friedmanniomyces simplex]